MNDLPEGYDYPPEVRFQVGEGDLEFLLGALTADCLFSNADIVSLQHEFGIYGGPAGSFILALLRDLRIPVVTTLHTVLRRTRLASTPCASGIVLALVPARRHE